MDTLIQGGTVYDGTGGRAQSADVRIRDGVILEIKPDLSAQNAQVICAHGKIVAPGFIDIHRHCDIAPYTDPNFGDIELAQGITMAVAGNRGLAPLPCTEAGRAEWYDFVEPVIGPVPQALSLQTYAEYAGLLERARLPLHMGFLAASGAIKAAVMGFSTGPYSSAGIARAQAYVREAMEAGALGVSLGIMYPPEAYSTEEEMAAVASAAHAYDGVLCVHIRGEGDGLVSSVEEAIRIAERAGLRLNISHFKAVGTANWRGAIFRAIDRIEAARARGQDITADFYPYDGGATTMLSLLPKTVLRGSTRETLKALATSQGKAFFKKELRRRHADWDNMALAIGWDRIIATQLTRPEYAGWSGLSIADIALRYGADDPADVLAELLIAEEGKAGVIVMSMSGDDVDDVARLPWTMLISDALYGGGESPHPRLYGSFPRFLRRFVMERSILPMEQAIRKMTRMPARLMRVPAAGALLPGYDADIVVFDSHMFTDNATYARPGQMASGMDWVLLGGVPVWHDGHRLQAARGGLLRVRNEGGKPKNTAARRARNEGSQWMSIKKWNN